MNLTELEQACEAFIDAQQGYDPAHDMNHLRRVVKTAREIADTESARLDIVLPGAWLHDCVCLPKNSPLRPRASSLSAEKAAKFLTQFDYPVEDIKHIRHTIEAHSFSADITPVTLEAKVVQDADRLDALGAIGIARCFATAGVLGSALYCEDDPFCESREHDDQRFCVDHFYRKLFPMVDQLHTDAARDIACKRIDFMQQFMSQLDDEISDTHTRASHA